VSRWLLALAAGAALVPAGAATAASAAPAALRVATTLQPAAVLYGDPVTATVEVDYAAGVVDPASIRVDPSFTPYVVTERPVVRRPQAGVVSFTYTLLCVTEGCLPTKSRRAVRLHSVGVTARAGSRTVHASGGWRPLRVSSRLTASDLSGPVRFRSPASPPTPAYRVAPGLLAGALLVAAALCALAALVVAGWGLVQLARRSRTRPSSLLELAVAYVRDSTRRSGPDRRRALSLLAEATGGDEPALAAAAAETAWSRPSPTPTVATELANRAAQVEEPSG
jgi:hypothetical protein